MCVQTKANIKMYNIPGNSIHFTIFVLIKSIRLQGKFLHYSHIQINKDKFPFMLDSFLPYIKNIFIFQVLLLNDYVKLL